MKSWDVDGRAARESSGRQPQWWFILPQPADALASPAQGELMAGAGPQDIDRRQAWFGPAYVAKLAAQAGYP